MAALKKRHKEETTQLKTKLSALEQQLTDARDGGSNSGLPESERSESELEKGLRAQLLTLTQDRDKLQTAKAHLEGMWEELQSEVQTLQADRHDRLTTLAQLERQLEQQEESHRQQVDALRDQLTESERCRMEVEHSRQQEAELKTSIAETGTQLQQVSSETESLIEQLGSAEAQEHTASVLDALERENLVLKEQGVKYQEQITLLEKRLASQQEEWQRGQETVLALKKQLKQSTGGTSSDSDNTLDQSLTTGSDFKSVSVATSGQEVGGAEEWQIQREALESALAELRQEVKVKDERIAELSSVGSTGEGEEGNELSSLRSDNQRLQQEVSSLQQEVSSLQQEVSSLHAEREELETSLSQLDEQHQQATDTLITSRNTLQQQVTDLQKELLNLSQQQGESPPTPDSSEDLHSLQQQLQASQQEITTLKNQLQGQEAEMSELKVKLQKGTLALNDLHMDKKDLEDDLAQTKEDVKAKVAAIKTLREEKAALVREREQLEERVHELEEEVESWEQRNEDSRLEEGQLTENLRAEIAELQAENSAQRDKLDSMFTELSEAKQLCRKVQQEKEEEGKEEDGDGIDGSLLTAVEEERDRALEEKERVVRERDRAIEDRNSTVEEKESLEVERDRLIEERDGLIEERDGLIEERDRLIRDRDQAFHSRDSALRERDSAVSERDAAVTEHDDTRQELDRTLQERDDILQERESAVRDRQSALSRVSELEERLSSVADKDEESEPWLLSKGEEYVSDLQARLDELQQQVELLSTEKTTLELEVRQLKGGLGVEESMLQQQTASVSHTYQSTHGNKHAASSQDHAEDLSAQNQQLSQAVTEREAEIDRLRHTLDQLQQDKSYQRQHSTSMEEQVASLESIIGDKDGEIERLYQDVRQLTAECDRLTARLSDSEDKMESLKTQLQETDGAFHQLQQDLEAAQQRCTVLADRCATLDDLQQQLDSARDTIQVLHADISEKDEILASQRAGIQDLNAKVLEQSRLLDKSQAKRSEQETAVAFLRQSSVTLEEEVAALGAQLDRACHFLTAEQRSAVLNAGQASSHSSEPPLASTSAADVPALEYHPKPALKDHASGGSRDPGEGTQRQKHDGDHMSTQQPNGDLGQGSGDSDKLSADLQLCEKHKSLCEKHEALVSQHTALAQDHAKLLQQVEDREDTLADLQRNNASLLNMLESKTSATAASSPRQQAGEGGNNLQLEVHRLQSEVKALKTEKEQMLTIMNEKSRESSSLKQEVMRLMNFVSAEKTALDKLQQDNQELMQARVTSPSTRDDSLQMTKEAMQNLSRLVRDKDMEIEALRQKNHTLMTILQDSSQEGSGISHSSLASQLVDKENLEKQLATLKSEREQMVAFLNQKHSESLAYHAEIQRLTAMRAEETQRFDQLQAEFESLRPQYEDNKQTLLKSQNDLINYKQKYAELEVRYGELLQRSNASETVDAASYRQLEEEKRRVEGKLAEFQQTAQGRDDKLHAVSEKLSEAERNSHNKDAEIMSLKKQVDSLQFQVHSLGQQTADMKQDQAYSEQWRQEQQANSQALKDLNNQLTLAVRDKEQQVTSLTERLHQLTTLLSQTQGEKTQVAQLLKDQEAASSVSSRLQQEVNQLTLSVKQKQQQLNDLHTENLRLKEKEQKLSREVERLRAHLLQIEDGYTREALEAEEREKTLRNRLAQAEEQLMSSSARIQSASQQASQQVESLQQQLHSVASQRDSAYMKVASLEDQCQQYASSLSNLQLVLEQFQAEKDSLVASETERYQHESERLREKCNRLQKEFEQTKVELEEATDGLAAASRLSEQLDRQEDTLHTFRLEVEKRDEALKKAQEEIAKLTSSKEAKVDRELMKNLLLGYFHTPDRNRLDAIHAIGSVLGFTQDDFHQIEESQGGGWISNMFRRTSPRPVGATPPTTPTTITGRRGPNQSFSQMFVKFLEAESTPPLAPMRLPAEEMAREVQEHHHKGSVPGMSRTPLGGASQTGAGRAPPAFNPFTAPRHVAMPLNVGPVAMAATSSASHLLMAPPPSSPTTAFPMFTPYTSPGEGGGRTGAAGPNTTSSSAILKDVLGSR